MAALLPDQELSSWARIALEAIPGEAADAALREALGKLQGRLLVGVINSLGVRRDVKAVDALIARLKDADADVAAVSALALGRIGGDAATQALEASLATAPEGVRSAVAEGCILCAERVAAAGKTADAVRIYTAVTKATVPTQRVLEATRGLILVQGSAGVPLLREQLQSTEKWRLALGLRVARELPGPEVTELLIAELGKAPPQRQALLILALADRGDKAALPAVLQVAKAGAENARSVALRALGRLGDAACVPVLLEAALDANAEVAQTAIAVLADMPGAEIDKDLAGRLLQAEGKSRRVLIELAGRRPIVGAAAALRKAADDPDGPTRAAALTALGATIEFADLDVLIQCVAQPRDGDDAAVAEKALATACQRMADREAATAKLIAALSPAATPGEVPLPGDPREGRWRRGLAGAGGRGQGRRPADPGHRQPAAGRVDGRGRGAGAARSGQERRGREVQDPGPARLYPAGAAIRHARRPAGGDVPRGPARPPSGPRRRSWSWR